MNPNAMKRFETNKTPVLFQIDDDTFMCVREIPAGRLVDLLKLQGELSQANDRTRLLDVIMEIVNMVLLPDAITKFEARLRDKENPIGLRTLVDVMKWLLGDAYGLRPTQPPSTSTDESEETAGTTSTDGAPLEESTPETSPGDDSST